METIIKADPGYKVILPCDYGDGVWHSELIPVVAWKVSSAGMDVVVEPISLNGWSRNAVLCPDGTVHEANCGMFESLEEFMGCAFGGQ